MDLPEEIQKLVSELGDSLLNSLAEDSTCRNLALRIQERGYDLCLVLEATHAPHEEDTVTSGSAWGSWSDEDARVLQDFRIALD